MIDWTTVKNPAFDVTPIEYVAGYIAEGGILKKNREELKLSLQ